jgi:hypothetical protein
LSHRPIIQKKLARLRKLTDRTPLVAYINALDWLQTRGYAKSNREAKEILTDGRLKVDSHPVGRERMEVQTPLTVGQRLKGGKPPEPVMEWVPSPLVRAELREKLWVSA